MPNDDASFDEALTAVWRQALVEANRTVELEGQSYPVRRTPRRGLIQIDFVFQGRKIRALEQNPETKSSWAQLARTSKKVMQFLEAGRYIANVADGRVTLYGLTRRKPRSTH